MMVIFGPGNDLAFKVDCRSTVDVDGVTLTCAAPPHTSPGHLALWPADADASRFTPGDPVFWGVGIEAAS